jgi:pimeloyl-ACP methyl ester carboxylesterase
MVMPAYPTIVVPGITGAYLQDIYPLPPETVWSVLTKDYSRVSLHPNDLRYEAGEPARVVPGQLYDIAYKELVEELRHNLSLKEDLPVPVFPFAYDWRQPLPITEPQLASFIDEVIARTKLLKHYDREGFADQPKVNLVGHSMGGLVIAGYLQNAGKSHSVHKVATLVTPFQGSFEAVIKIATGTADLGEAAPSSREREAARLTPALYQLIPSFRNGLDVAPGLPNSLFDPEIWQPSIIDTLKEYIRLHGLDRSDRDGQARQLFAGLLKAAADHRKRIDGLALNTIGLTADDWLCVVGVGTDTRVKLKVVKSGRVPDFQFSTADRQNQWANPDQQLRMFTGDGTVPFEGARPKFLALENLVCVTPGEVYDAQVLFFQIMGQHINVVTLLDGRVYSRESVNNNPTDLIVSIAIMMRGNEESATKSRRLSAAYERKRKDALDGKRFTRAVPAWLTWNDKVRKPALIPERAKLLRGIFQKADTGWSKHRIARWLNERGVETWGTGKRKADYWHSSYIAKLLTNPAVTGTFTPHRALKEAGGVRKREALAPIENYFPAAISSAVFGRVSAQAKTRAARGRNADTEPRSIFAGVLKCANCGGTVTRVSKGQHVYLVCSRANQRAKGCRYRAVPYGTAEEAMRVNAKHIVGNAPRGRDTAELEEEIEGQDVLVGVLLDEAQELLNIYVRDKSEAARQRLQEKEAELRTERAHLSDLSTRRDALTSVNVKRRLDAARSALEREPINVTEANRALRQAVSRIVMDPEQSTLTIYWHHAEQPSEAVPIDTRRYAAAIFGAG